MKLPLSLVLAERVISSVYSSRSFPSTTPRGVSARCDLSEHSNLSILNTTVIVIQTPEIVNRAKSNKSTDTFSFAEAIEPAEEIGRNERESEYESLDITLRNLNTKIDGLGTEISKLVGLNNPVNETRQTMCALSVSTQAAISSLQKSIDDFIQNSNNDMLNIATSESVEKELTESRIQAKLAKEFVQGIIDRRFITDIDLNCQVHAVRVVPKPDDSGRDSLIVISRHSIFSLLQYDSTTGTIRTIGQAFFGKTAIEDFAVQASSNSPFVTSLLRVCNQMVATSFNESAITFFNCMSSSEPTSTAYSISIRPSEKIQLVSAADLQFIDVSQQTGIATAAILGKVHDDAWVGKPPGSPVPPLPTQSGCIRIVSVDIIKRSYSILWSFEKLPSDSFGLIPLTQGMLVVAPKSLTYCHDFSSSTTVDFNDPSTPPPQFLSGTTESTAPFEIDLEHSKWTVVGPDSILFALKSGHLVTCHCIRKQLHSPIVSEYIWEVSSSMKFPISSLSKNGKFLFAGSSQSHSKLFQVSVKKIPIDKPCDDDLVSSNDPLIDSYMREIQEDFFVDSIELGIVDELINPIGQVSDMVAIEPIISDPLVAQGPLGESLCSRILTTNSDGKMHLTTSQIDMENVFETVLRHKFEIVENYITNSGRSILCLGTANFALIIDSTNGLKELVRKSDGYGEDEKIIGFLGTSFDETFVVGISSKNIFFLPIVDQGSKTAKQSIPFSSPSDRVRIDRSATHCIVSRLVDPVTIEVITLGVEKFEIISTTNITHSVAITSWYPTISNAGEVFVVVSDSNGSLFIWKNEKNIFHAKHVSLCLPILRHVSGEEIDGGDHESSNIIASLSVTDPTCRPVEPNPSTGAFAQKISISEARLVYISKSSLIPHLVILIEGRPVLIYAPLSDDLLSWRLLISNQSSTDLFENNHNISSGLVVVSRGGGPRPNDSITIRMNKLTTILVSEDVYRRKIFVHNFGIDGGVNGISFFNSEFIQDATVATHDDGRLCIWRPKHGSRQEIFCGFPTVEFDLQNTGESHPGITGEKISVSVAGVAVACMYRLREEETSGEVMVIEPSRPSDGVDMEQDVGEMDPEAANAASIGGGGVGIGITHSTSTAPPPSTLKTNKRYMVKIFSPIDLETVIACIKLQAFEHVTDMCWASTVVGLGNDVLVIGTTFGPGGISSIAQGRLILVRVNYAPGTTQPEIDMNEMSTETMILGGFIIFESVKRSAVTIVRDWRHCVAIGLDQRLMFYQWDASANRLRGCGMYDMSLQVSSMTFMKNYIVAGDVLRGVQFLRWKEDPVIDPTTGLMKSTAASIQFLAKSSPYTEIFVKKLETVVFESSAGILSLDTYSNLDLTMFSPLHYGQYLRPCVPFQLPTRARATTFLGDLRNVVVAMNSGSFGFLVPVNEGDHHLSNTLAGLMVTLLPMTGGINPKLSHVAIGRDPAAIPGAVQAIEGVSILRQFLFLSTPLQAEIASRMKQPIDALMRHIQRWTRLEF